jgi:hypothetical protein
VRSRSWPGTGFDGGTLWMPYAPDRSNRKKKKKKKKKKNISVVLPK